MRRRLRDPDVARYDGLVDLGAEMRPDVGRDHLREVVPLVEHRQDDSEDLERRVEGAPHPLDGADEMAQPFEGVELDLERDQDGVRRAKRVQCQQVERGRAVDQDIVEARDATVDRVLEAKLALIAVDQLELGARKVDRGGDDREARDRGRHHRPVERHAVHQDVVGGRFADGTSDAEPGARVPLRIEVDDQDRLPDRGQRGGQVDRRGRLADAALLVRHGDDAGPPARRRAHGDSGRFLLPLLHQLIPHECPPGAE